PTTGSAADRVRAGGVRSSIVLENVARAYGISEAQQGLMNSPGHRANLLSREVTHVGVGIVLGDEVAGRRELFVTQLFTRVGAAVDLAQAHRKLVARIGSVRAVEEDPALGSVAQRLAEDLARGEVPSPATAR